MNTLESLEQRASRALQHVLSQIETVGEEGVLAVERLAGLAPAAAPVIAGPVVFVEPQDDPNIKALADLTERMATAVKALADKDAVILALQAELDTSGAMIANLRASVDQLMTPKVVASAADDAIIAAVVAAAPTAPAPLVEPSAPVGPTVLDAPDVVAPPPSIMPEPTNEPVVEPAPVPVLESPAA